MNAYQLKAKPNICEVLKDIILKTGEISGLELSKRTGLPVATVNRLLSGAVIDPRASTLKPLANYFGINVDQLLGYSPLPSKYSNNNDNIRPSIGIPLFKMNSCFDEMPSPKNWFTWVTENGQQKTEAFAFMVDSHELEPVFYKDTILIVEPSHLPPQDSDYLAIRFNRDSRILVKRFLIDGKDQYFVPLKPQLPALPVNLKTHSIIGIITEAHTKLKG